jgi:hypothetical protein
VLELLCFCWRQLLLLLLRLGWRRLPVVLPYVCLCHALQLLVCEFWWQLLSCILQLLFQHLHQVYKAKQQRSLVAAGSHLGRCFSCRCECGAI